MWKTRVCPLCAEVARQLTESKLRADCSVCNTAWQGISFRSDKKLSPATIRRQEMRQECHFIQNRTLLPIQENGIQQAQTILHVAPYGGLRISATVTAARTDFPFWLRCPARAQLIDGFRPILPSFFGRGAWRDTGRPSIERDPPTWAASGLRPDVLIGPEEVCRVVPRPENVMMRRSIVEA